jgi:hypothetical protein
MTVEDFAQGYDCYKLGSKVPADEDRIEFYRGWWAAEEAGEKFGKYDSFLFAPDPKE